MQAITNLIKSPEFFFVFISASVYTWFCWFDKNHDMERYYVNKDTLKYKLLIYSKYVLLFSIVYNVKAYVFNLFKKLLNR